MRVGNIGLNIRALREREGLTQIELAKKVCVSSVLLCQVERGSKACSLPLALAIAEALHCTINDIVA